MNIWNLEADLTASISVQHIYCEHEFQQKKFTNTISPI